MTMDKKNPTPETTCSFQLVSLLGTLSPYSFSLLSTGFQMQFIEYIDLLAGNLLETLFYIIPCSWSDL